MMAEAEPLGLAIHTSSPELGLAIAPANAPIKSRVWPLGRDLSAQFHPCLKEFLQPHGWSDLALIAVAIGPGEFTGTRIGVVAARTLAQQLNIPLYGISSLGAIAAAQGPHLSPASGQIAVQMRAQRGEVFGAIYELTPEALLPRLPDRVYAQADWQHVLSTWPDKPILVKAEDGLGGTVEQVLALAWQRWQRGDRPQWSEVLPYYGQHPVQSG
ncbi:tRNA (adenosine(37)-N6)-threonylcarbamoyltransferase complex dimerization subunit type 1 TsaB [filamentous cyanobacterium CCP5]|nr:tRNA (adenosine(37)-N6)-threonylcarbamoyltransferase complex dimerization subunit type 1 TsaB [filamentous cyanobacterium CCP5]